MFFVMQNLLPLSRSIFLNGENVFFEKQRFSNIWYSNWCRNCIFCSILLKFEMQPPQVSLSTWLRLRRTRGEPSARTWGICPDHQNLRIFFVFTFSTIFYKKIKQNMLQYVAKTLGQTSFTQWQASGKIGYLAWQNTYSQTLKNGY